MIATDDLLKNSRLRGLRHKESEIGRQKHSGADDGDHQLLRVQTPTLGHISDCVGQQWLSFVGEGHGGESRREVLEFTGVYRSLQEFKGVRGSITFGMLRLKD